MARRLKPRDVLDAMRKRGFDPDALKGLQDRFKDGAPGGLKGMTPEDLLRAMKEKGITPEALGEMAKRINPDLLKEFSEGDSQRFEPAAATGAAAEAEEDELKPAHAIFAYSHLKS